MRLYINLPLESQRLTGMCEACGSQIDFLAIDDGAGYDYYNADEVVNTWMDHQLNGCGSDIDNNAKSG